MKKLLSLIVVGLALIGCGDDKSKGGNASASTQEKVVLKVGATPVPHAEILEFIKPDLAQEGIDLQIVPFTDYVQPNISLNDGSLDANFHQHKPFLDALKADKGLKLEPIAAIHIEPMGLYSKNLRALMRFHKMPRLLSLMIQVMVAGHCFCSTQRGLSSLKILITS